MGKTGKSRPAWVWWVIGALGVAGAVIGVSGVFGSRSTEIPAEPVPNAIFALAEAGITRNAGWEPYIEEFDGVPMALVPAGCFRMGSTDEQVHYAMELYL